MSDDRPTRPGAAAHSPEGPHAPDQRASVGLPGRTAPPAPREADDLVVTGAITAGWAVALVALGVLSATGVLPPEERWWVWTCAVGLVMGLFGLWYVPLLKRGRERAMAQRAGTLPSGPGRAGQPSAEPSSESRASGSKTVSSTETPGSSTRS